MACNCITKVCERLTEDLKKKDINLVSKPSFVNACFPLTDDMQISGYVLSGPVEYIYLHKYKNGNEVERKRKMNLVYTYCPICGKKYKETEQNNE